MKSLLGQMRKFLLLPPSLSFHKRLRSSKTLLISRLQMHSIRTSLQFSRIVKGFGQIFIKYFQALSYVSLSFIYNLCANLTKLSLLLVCSTLLLTTSYLLHIVHIDSVKFNLSSARYLQFGQVFWDYVFLQTYRYVLLYSINIWQNFIIFRRCFLSYQMKMAPFDQH